MVRRRGCHRSCGRSVGRAGGVECQRRRGEAEIRCRIRWPGSRKTGSHDIRTHLPIVHLGDIYEIQSPYSFKPIILQHEHGLHAHFFYLGHGDGHIATDM
jgi:hypothetical protein